MNEKFIDRVIIFLKSIPDTTVLEMKPSIFSDEIDRHDCDNCSSSKYNQGDTFDHEVCVSCWEDAIRNAGVTRK